MLLMLRYYFVRATNRDADLPLILDNYWDRRKTFPFHYRLSRGCGMASWRLSTSPSPFVSFRGRESATINTPPQRQGRRAQVRPCRGRIQGQMWAPGEKAPRVAR